MTRDEAITLIMNRCGNRAGDTALEAAAVLEMKLVQESLEGGAFLPWFLLVEMQSTTNTAEEDRLQLPTSFLREYEEGVLYVYDSTDSGDPWMELVKDDFGALKAAYPGTAETPTHYALVGDYFRLFPQPTTANTLKMLCYESGTALSSDVENDWLKHAGDLMIAKTGEVMAGQYLHNDTLKAKFEKAGVVAMDRLMRFDEARKQAAADQMMGDD